MPIDSFATSSSALSHGLALALPVLKLFLIPVGGGIPAGVLAARDSGLAWPVTSSLYLLSDLILALAFEPVLRLLAAVSARVPLLVRCNAALKAATAPMLIRHLRATLRSLDRIQRPAP